MAPLTPSHQRGKVLVGAPEEAGYAGLACFGGVTLGSDPASSVRRGEEHTLLKQIMGAGGFATLQSVSDSQ